MAIQFTEKQTRVLEARDHNILVSAAAGSGKTAVLVERIVRMISEGERPLDIDRLLVVTFTRAGAYRQGRLGPPAGGSVQRPSAQAGDSDPQRPDHDHRQLLQLSAAE